MSGEVVDLFGGAGGWDVAARRLGLDPVGVELDEDACATRDAAGLRTVQGDVAAMDPPDTLAGLIGSPPCQAWSKAGKRLGERDKPIVFATIARLADGLDVRARARLSCADERSLLVVEPLRWALDSGPAWIVLEQVPDVLEVWERFAVILRGRGYHVWTGVLNAANFGVPQTRLRAILIASRERPVGPPAPSHSDQRRGGCLLGLQPWVSMADALGDPGFRTGHETARRQKVDVDRPAPAVTGKSGGQWLWRNGNQENACERAPDEPAPTLHFGNALNDVKWVRERPATTVQGTPRIGRPGHKNRDQGTGGAQFESESVPVTAAEAARLQDFPAGFPFQGSRTSVFRQIGNAIPPGLALAVLQVATGLPVREEAA